MAKRKATPIPANTYKGTIGIDLPMPTSTNRNWRSGIVKAGKNKGKPFVYRNPVYLKWKEAADLELMRQQVGKGWHTITGPFNVDLVVDIKKRFKIDLDNRIKGLLDWAKGVGLIAEDKYQNEVRIRWGEVPMGVHMTLTPAEDLS